MFRCGSLPQPGVSITVATSPSHCSSTTASELGLLEFAKGATSSCSSVTASSSEMGSAAGSELDGSENDEESVARPAVARAHKLTSARLVPIAEFESRMETTLAWMLGMEEHLIRNSGEDNLVTRKRWRKRGDGNRRITSSLLGSGVETRNSPLLKDPSSATRSTEMSGEPAIEQQKETLGVLEREAGEEGEYTEEEEDEEDDEDVQKQVEWIKDSDFFAVEETSDIQHLAELARLSFSGRIGGEPSVGVSSTGSHSVTNPAPEREALVERIHQRLLDRLDMAKKRFETHEDLTAHLSRRQAAVARCLRQGLRLTNAARELKLGNTQGHYAPTTFSSSDAENAANAFAAASLSSILADCPESQITELLNFDVPGTRHQMRFLATQWNHLRRATYKMGRCLALRLFSRQEALLNAVGIHLQRLEEEK